MKWREVKTFRTTAIFNSSVTQGSTIPLHPIDNEQYLDMNNHHWQLDEDQWIDYQYQFHLQSYQLVSMLLNPANLMLFVDLTRSFIKARKLAGFL